MTGIFILELGKASNTVNIFTVTNKWNDISPNNFNIGIKKHVFFLYNGIIID